MRLVRWRKQDGLMGFTHVRNERRTGYTICGLRIGPDEHTAPEDDLTGELVCMRCKAKNAHNGRLGISFPGSIKR